MTNILITTLSILGLAFVYSLQKDKQDIKHQKRNPKPQIKKKWRG